MAVNDADVATPTGRAVSIEREMFPAWVGHGLYAWPGGGRFIDIGTPATYAAGAEFFAPDADDQESRA